MTQRHMHMFGTTPEQLAQVSITFRDHAGLNPNAVMRSPIDLDAYLGARMICEPLRLLDYCLITDGGVALIITSQEHARDLPSRRCISAAAGSRRHSPIRPSRPTISGMRRCSAAGRSIAMAGTRPRRHVGADDLRQFHADRAVFAGRRSAIARPARAAPLSRRHLGLGHRYPTNTSGGHLSECYMQGWALNVEAVRQLRGECGARQVEDARNVHYLAASPVVPPSSIRGCRHEHDRGDKAAAARGRSGANLLGRTAGRGGAGATCACGHHRFPASRYCAVCHSADFKWTVVEPEGVLVSFCAFHKQYFPGLPVPYAVVQVRLRCGVRMFSNLLHVPIDRIRHRHAGDSRIRERCGGVTLLKFRPLENAA